MFRVRALYDGARSITLSLSALFAVACVISGVSMRKVPARLIPISHRFMCVSGLLARPGNNLPTSVVQGRAGLKYPGLGPALGGSGSL